jgi:putative transposase
MLEYKCDWYGRELIAVDRWHPSSKACSGCGLIREHLPLNVRVWTCESCGVTHDRDTNAARNLLAARLAVSACGAGVRPQRKILPDGAVGGEAGRLRRSVA